ncbi:hypothetical protein BGZ96_007685 [Linnemannia gamsii]|uniref:Replication factor A protein 3 n=1 Tax=Linnemannia gamsii TaxID=64522 RepID=A0ABQ7JZV0_9FUNG|nr:hypothetical protein BGZ96_007685 [Linnemannia gamsii]
MSLPTTKRVNSAMLQNCVGETVRLVGEFKSNSLYGTKFVEVIGSVNPDRSITEWTSSNFGDDFNMETYDAMVVKAQKFPSVF